MRKFSPRALPEFLAGLWGALFPKGAEAQKHGRWAGWDFCARLGFGAARKPVTRALFIAGSLVLAGAALTLTVAALGNREAAARAEEKSRSVRLSTAPERATLEAALAFDPGVRPRPWTAIVLHHSATLRGSARSFGRYHRQHRGWHSLGYHFVIGNGAGVPDGAIETGPRWRRQERGAHAHSAEFNDRGIGICLVGNFEQQAPTGEQLRSVKALVRALMQRFQIPARRVFGHREIREGGGTVCPGRLFPLKEIRAALVKKKRFSDGTAKRAVRGPAGNFHGQ